MSAAAVDRGARLLSLQRSVNAMRSDTLTADEVRDLDIIAFGDVRRRERQAQRAAALSAIHTAALEFGLRTRMHERALVASLGEPGAAVQHWEGPIGFEGVPTGDGRVIQPGALTTAQFPMPLRWSPVDFGAHDGAIVVGRIDHAERRPDGTIHARGVIDLGSQMGREAARLIRAGMLGGVSVDLDQTTMTRRAPSGSTESLIVTSEARVRAATLVAIPAFANARITLTDAPDRLVELTPHDPAEPTDDDCGCDEPTPGVRTFPGIDAFPTLDQMPDITEMTTLAAHARAAASTTVPTGRNRR